MLLTSIDRNRNINYFEPYYITWENFEGKLGGGDRQDRDGE